LAHNFRDKLYKDIYENDKKMGLLEEKIDHEVEKVFIITIITFSFTPFMINSDSYC
jgi:hypothetical protein